MNLVKKLNEASLFVKIVLVFICGHLFFATSMWHLKEFFFENYHAKNIHNTAYNYSSLIIDKIGTPPDTSLARKYADDLHINIRIKTNSFEWANSKTTPHFEDLELKDFHAKFRSKIGFDEGLHVKTERGNIDYLISIQRDEYDFKFYDHLFIIIALSWFTIVLYIMYRVVRKILTPVMQLKEGVDNVSKGIFNNVIETNRTDELGKLINSFNTMNREVREMIKSRDQLLLDVSHELRTPITRVKLALEFMDDSKPKVNIQDDIKEIETMISELLETERLGSKFGGLKKEYVVVNQLLEEVSINFANREPGVVINTKNSYSMNGDPERLKTLFRNIVDNALKYSSNQPKPVEINLTGDSSNIKISIQDFGEGIPETELTHIFEPFYRVDKSRSKETGGYGLGMHLSQKIVEAHGGEIEITSKINNGSNIIITFPI